MSDQFHYSELKEDIQEIKADVKDIHKMLYESTTNHKLLEQRVSNLSGKVNVLLTAVGTIASALLYSLWGWLRSKFGIH